MTTHSAREAGFSVLELLAVVMMLGLIATLGVPVYEHAMMKARRSEMLDTLRQISHDELLYHGDSGDFYPETESPGSQTAASVVYPPGSSIYLMGQDRHLELGRRSYRYTIFRFDSLFSEPVIYAYAATAVGNDLDGDSYPDLWIKVGGGTPEVYYDDILNARDGDVSGGDSWGAGSDDSGSDDDGSGDSGSDDDSSGGGGSGDGDTDDGSEEGDGGGKPGNGKPDKDKPDKDKPDKDKPGKGKPGGVS